MAPRTQVVVLAAGMFTTRPSAAMHTRRCHAHVALERAHLESLASANPQHQNTLSWHRLSTLGVGTANLYYLGR